MSSDEIRELAIDKGQVPFEEEPCNLKYPDDFNVDLVRTWAQRARDVLGSGHDLRDDEILENRFLGKIENGQFRHNNACALVFGKNPRSIFPGCFVRIIRFEGTEEKTDTEFNATNQFWIEWSIPDIIHRSAEAVSGLLRTFSPLNEGGKFELLQTPAARAAKIASQMSASMVASNPKATMPDGVLNFTGLSVPIINSWSANGLSLS